MAIPLAAALLFSTISAETGSRLIVDGAGIEARLFDSEKPQLRLNFPASKFDRRTLPNGVEMVRFDGSITNISKHMMRVPPLRLVLRDAQDRVVYSVIIPASRGFLKAGKSLKVSQTYLGVPKSAKVAEIGWKPV